MFIQIIEGRCSRPEDLRAMSDEWQREIGPTVPGWLGATYGFTDDGTFVGVVRFDSREAAEASSARPEQGAWWSRMEKLFDGPVTFHDCSDVIVMMDGGSDAAQFVQVIKGRVNDPDKVRALLADTSMLHEARPDILGGTFAIEEDGHFVETISFVDEQSARAGEKVEMPSDMRADMDAAMTMEAFLDLHHPWFASQAASGRG